MAKDVIEEELFEEEIEAPVKDIDDRPSMMDDEWNDYVMSHFKSNELIEGNPICAGLRRVAELLLGDIVESGPVEVYPAMDTNGPGRATVVFKVVFNWFNSDTYRTYKEVADVWHGNTDDLFCAHPVATASTRAEGRALRKALKLRCLAAEELAKKDIVNIVKKTVAVSTEDTYNPAESITSQQVQFVDKRCACLDINVVKFINMGEHDYADIKDISRDTAKDMIKYLNQYQNEDVKIPSTITGYDKNWRN